jgi:hypothetical protein
MVVNTSEVQQKYRSFAVPIEVYYYCCCYYYYYYYYYCYCYY